jgi:YD repeat-containing protein
MRKYIILLIGLVFNVNCYGQQLPNVIPPSPEAAQLAKFVETPVSLYNGTPTINIPITTVNAGSLTIPISIIYDAKGIMVAEQATRVGTGWTLSAGGSITRQVRMKVDEFSLGYMDTQFTDDFHINEVKRGNMWGHSQSPDYNENYDFYPDLYFFNFLGFSGTFIFDQMTKMPVLQKADDIKILPIFQNNNFYSIKSWEVVDDKGVRYIFGDGSVDMILSQPGYKWTHGTGGGEEVVPNTTGQHVNSWHLIKIINPEGTEINFEYEKEYVFYYAHGGDQNNNNIYSTSYSRINMQQSQLKSIEYKNEKVYFDKSIETREDLSQGHTLKAIRKVERKGSEETLIKNFNFNYSYTTAPQNNNLLLTLKLVDNFAFKRLYLNEVYEVSTNGNDTLRYKLDYNSIVLPNRHSTSVDNWGYYNGKNNGEYLKSVFDSFDSRVVNSNLSEAGMLKKITYPTGGETEFVYEHNRLKPPHFFSNLMFPKTNPIQSPSMSVLHNASSYTGSRYINELIFPEGLNSVPMTVTVWFDWTNCPEGVDTPSCQYEIYLKQNNVVLYKLLRGTNTITLSSGTYIVEAIPKQPHNPNDFEASNFSVVFKWVISEPNEQVELYGPGKRIKKIIQRDGGTILSEKEYLYIDDDGKSSGQLFSIPAYHDIVRQYPGGYWIGGSLICRATPIGLFIGNKYGYSKVTEMVRGKNENLKTEFYFTNYPDTGEFYKFPYHLPNDMGWTRGMSLETKYYKNNNNVYSLVKKVKNQYIYYNNSNFPAAVPGVIENIDPLDNGSPLYYTSFKKTRIPIYKFGKSLGELEMDPTLGPNDFLISHYYAGRCNLFKTEEINYFGSNTVVDSLTFNHDATNHHQLTSKYFINSLGEEIETKFFYPLDEEMIANPFVTQLKLKNIISNPLLIINYKNNEIISSQETVYNNWGNTNNLLLLPEFIKTSKGNHSLEDRIKYNVVDESNGNPLEVEQKGGMKISYIWGYNKTLPVAKLENISYANIPSALITAIENVTDLPTSTEAQVGAALEAIRTSPISHLQNAMITTLTYKPLVGVSTITDPKGQTTIYEYDGFGRLERVRDHLGNILSETDYHYRTPN